MMDSRVNDILLVASCGGIGVPSNFKLKEFANAEGIAVVHSSLLTRLQYLRLDLGTRFGEEILIIITSGTRTEADLERLAATLGWIDEGGAVARNSKHLVKWGGIAADIKCVKAVSKERIPQEVVGEEARKLFPYVKDDYRDGHVHVDCWDREKGEVV